MIIKEKPLISLKRFFLTKSAKDKKRNRKYAKRFAAYHDYILDDYVLSDELPDEDKIYSHLKSLNSIPITEDYRRIGVENKLSRWDKKKLTDDKYDTIKKVAEIEALAILSNLSYAKTLKNNTDFDTEKYKETIHKNPEIDRRTILNESITGTKPALSPLEIERYKNPEIFAENIYRQKQLETAHESALMNPDILYKTWVWSELENTRHSLMDGDTVRIDDDFYVINEVSGEADYMAYPHDPKGSPGNIFNCQCDVYYHAEKWGEKMV